MQRILPSIFCSVVTLQRDRFTGVITATSNSSNAHIASQFCFKKKKTKEKKSTDHSNQPHPLSVCEAANKDKPTTKRLNDQTLVCVDISRPSRSSGRADWKPTVGVCIEIIHQAAIKACDVRDWHPSAVWCCVWQLHFHPKYSISKHAQLVLKISGDVWSRAARNEKAECDFFTRRDGKWNYALLTGWITKLHIKC